MASLYPLRAHGVPRAAAYSQPVPAAQGPALLEVGLAVAAIFALIDLFGSNKQPQRKCGVCERTGHDRRTCPHDGERLNFSRSILKSSRCQCCGSSRYEMQRHHTRGRASLSNFLDVCTDCHLECCHGGHFQGFARKPQTCCISGRPSVWRG